MPDIVSYKNINPEIISQPYYTAYVTRDNGRLSASDVYANDGLNKDAVVCKGSLDYDPDSVVNMDFVGRESKQANSQGWLRDSKAFALELYCQRPEAFSNDNLIRIENNKALVIDKTMSDSFQQYRGFEGETLIHHHIGGDGQAVGVPASLHIGYGGVHQAELNAGIRDNAEMYSSFYENTIAMNPSLTREEINELYYDSIANEQDSSNSQLHFNTSQNSGPMYVESTFSTENVLNTNNEADYGIGNLISNITTNEADYGIGNLTVDSSAYSDYGIEGLEDTETYDNTIIDEGSSYESVENESEDISE